MAAWLVSIPAVQESTGVSHATLGLLLLVLGAGGVIGMQIAGYAIARWGSKIVTGAALALYVVAVNLPVHTTGPLTLGVALLIFGLANGAVDVSMNDQAVIVERGYGRPDHVGLPRVLVRRRGGRGADRRSRPRARLPGQRRRADRVVGGRCRRRHLRTVAAARETAPATEADHRRPRRHSDSGGGAQHPPPGDRLRRARLPADAGRGVANDWSALHAVEHLDRPASTAALAYATFAVAMTVGRLTVDRIAGRFGPAFVVRYGSLAAAVGIGTVMISPAFALTLVGWAVFGLGLAGVVPQLFTAAGNISSTNQSIILSRVVGAGYVGQLAGPALVGVVAGWVGLNAAFALPLIFCVVAVVVAPIVSRPADAVDEPAGQPVEPSYESDRA